MDHAQLRDAALALPGAVEMAHMGKADFRAGGRIFATLPGPGLVTLKLLPAQQEALVAAEPGRFAPVPGGWGRQGWTHLTLAGCDEATLRSALTTAWGNVAPKEARGEAMPKKARGETPPAKRRR